MLHLAGRIGFGVNVGDLLHFERALEGHREVDAAAEEEKIRRPVETLRQFGDVIVFLEDRFEVFRERR